MRVPQHLLARCKFFKLAKDFRKFNLFFCDFYIFEANSLPSTWLDLGDYRLNVSEFEKKGEFIIHETILFIIKIILVFEKMPIHTEQCCERLAFWTYTNVCFFP